MGQWMATSLTTVADTDTYRDVRARARYFSSAGVDDSSNEFVTDGGAFFSDVNRSENISIPYNGGDQLLFEQTVRINKQYGSTQSASFAASIKGINYWGVSQKVSDSSSMTISARPYAVPTAPINVAVSRNSDSSQTVSWQRQASTAGRYQTQRVQRRTFNGSWGAWYTVATLGTDYTTAGSQSWTDTSTVGNRAYRYRVQAINSSGTGTSSASGVVYTTPTRPTAVSAAKSVADVVVTISPAHVVSAAEFVIEHSTDGGTSWSALDTVSASTSSATYTHTAPDPADTHTYRVAVAIDAPTEDAGDNLTSTWRTSNTVQLAAPPNAPSGLGPTSPRDATEPVTLSWIHNPVDTSDQSKFQIRHRGESFDSWTTEAEVESAASEWTLPADTYSNGDVPEWEVRTWGQHVDPSPWSATASFPTYARPTVAVSAPAGGSTLTDSALFAEWAYYQAEFFPQSQWRATLLNSSGQVVETRDGSGSTSSTSFETPGADGQSYTIRVEVRASFGMWSEPDEVSVGVEYLPPALVDVDPEWNRESGAVALTLTAQVWDDATTVEPITATVHRSSDGGRTWKLIAQNVPLQGGETAVPDSTAPTRATVLYRVTSTSALPSTAVAEPVELAIDELQFAYLGRGASFANVLVFYGNLTVGSSVERAEEVEYFAGRTGEDNRPAGLLISGERRSRELPVTARLINAEGYATRDDFEQAALAGGVMLYRDSTGRSAYVKIGRVETSQTTMPFTEVYLNLTEVGAVA